MVVKQGGEPTDRLLREIADALAERDQFRLMVESVVDYAIYMLDASGHVATWNEGAHRLKGYPEAEILGKPYEQFFPPEDVAAGKPRHVLAEAERLGRYEDEGWRVRQDGTRFWADAVITALRAADGRLLGYAKVTRDLTERRANEERLRLQARELAELNARLIEADHLKDRFLSILSHELRTPINAIMGFASLMDDGAGGQVSPDQHHYLGKILDGADQLLALVEDLLDIGRIQSGHFVVVPAALAPRSVLDGAIELIAPLVRARGQTLEVEAPAEVPPLLADPQRVRQVLVNLLGNAVKFSPAGTPIAVRLRATGTGVRYEVADRGPGIAAADVPRLFQPFSQVRPADLGLGTGLGLSICRAIVEAHGGRIGVDTAPGQGSTFWFELDRAPPHPA